ncbi:YhfC family intramembrane metalloprotease [Thermoflavimicrobium dichotomicum]|uniref:Uncharacterized membrane protein YhfC n=1 Tax=Thermoflavimicrobium dichotomicum TaxID=46223 RepID=A0A1I3UAM2_9BACL|nr:YhfC family glutamic-type intramembrane protease [Thermoflavimicrobium dichotomicum]SFJ78837.1 Uncharacterized membrane protein YhfC [Thermoflavimicrobium dichotomicum]
MVSQLSIVSMVVQLILSIGFPIFLLIYFRKRMHLSWKAVVVGVLTFVVFALGLEGAFNFYMVETNRFTSNLIKNTPWLMALYGALAAGIFEEVGRYISYSVLLKGFRERQDGIAYGIGHGGIEAIFIGVKQAIPNISLALMVNSGSIQSLIATQPMLVNVKKALIETPFYMYWLAGFERMGAVFLQIALSLVVLYGVKNKKIGYLFLAIFLHAFMNIFAGLYQMKLLPLLVVFVLLVIFAVIAVIAIRKSRKWFA